MRTQRIFMTIDRGPMDKTAVVVYPWEKPLLEEVHKGGASEVTLDQLCEMHNPRKVVKQKMPYAADADCKKDNVPDLRAQYITMQSVAEDEDPCLDPGSEFARLCGKYGMHPDVKMLVVEKVYGSEQIFHRMLRDYRRAKTRAEAMECIPSLGADEPVEDGEEQETPIQEMTKTQLAEILKKHDIPIPHRATVEKMRELAVSVAA